MTAAKNTITAAIIFLQELPSNERLLLKVQLGPGPLALGPGPKSNYSSLKSNYSS